MSHKSLWPISLLSAILITLLFHQQSKGLNLFIFETLIIQFFLIKGRIKFNNFLSIASSITLLISSIFVVVNNSNFVLTMNFVSYLVFVGVHLYTDSKSIITSAFLSIVHLFESQRKFFTNIPLTKNKGKKRNSLILLNKLKILLVPILIIIMFHTIYGYSNQKYGNISSAINNFIGDAFDSLIQNIEFSLVFTFLIGFVISNFSLFQSANKEFVDYDKEASDQLERKRKQISILLSA